VAVATISKKQYKKVKDITEQNTLQQTIATYKAVNLTK